MREELKITSLRLDSQEDTVFFWRKGAEVDESFHDRLDTFAKTSPGDLRLHGFVSDDEYTDKPALRTKLARDRAAAVAAFLIEKGWTGKYEFTEGANNAAHIDYRERRKVVVKPLEEDGESIEEAEPEAEPPAPAEFEVARKAALAKAMAAVTALEGKTDTANLAALTMFGEKELAALADSVRSMSSILSTIREVGKPTEQEELPSGEERQIPRYRYYERGGPNLASTTGTGDETLMKFGPAMKLAGAPKQAGTFLHESAHAASAIKANDHTYEQDRLFKFLSMDQKYSNADHYELLVEAIASNTMPVLHETDTYPNDLSRAKQLEIGGAIAYAEVYLRFGKQEIYHTFRYAWATVYAAKQFNSAYDDTLADLRKVFKTDLSTVALTKEDLHVMAGVHHRILKVLNLVDEEKLSIVLGDATSFNADTNQLTIGGGFFDLSPRKQVKSILAALVVSAGTPEADRDTYVELAKTIAGSQNRLR